MGNQVTSDLVKAGSEITRNVAGQALKTMKQLNEAVESSVYRPGLENFGHTCYMNVSIQSLFACEEFRAQVIVNGKKNDAHPIHRTLAQLFEEMALSQERCLSPRQFRDAFIDIHREFRLASEEHDVPEFISCLLDELNEETSWHQKDVGGAEPDFANAEDAWNYYLRFRANSYLVPLFAGQYSYITTCKNGHSWNRYQSYWNVQLPIPKTRGEGTWDIMHCLVELGRPERLPGVFCHGCNDRVDAKRMQTICRVPDYLFMSLNVFEFSWTAGKLSPGLRINENINVIGNPYTLYAVILHHGGTPQQGHYTCYVHIGPQWYLCNDRVVNGVGTQFPDQKSFKDAYVLLYEKDEGRANRERGMGGETDLENRHPGLIETGLINWREVPLPAGFQPAPPPPPPPLAKPLPGPIPQSKKFPAWEKKFGDWTVLEAHIRETPRDKPLLPADERFLAKKGIYVTNKQLGSGEFGDVWMSNLKGYQKDARGNAIDWKLACKIITLSNYDKGTISVKEATERMAKEEEILKKIHPQGELQERLFDKFRELNLMKKVADTPHIIKTEKIVRIYDEKSKFPFPYKILIFMDPCPLTLDKFLNACGSADMAIGEERSCVLVAQIGSALKYLHARFIAHLDIKPTNILIKQNPQNPAEFMFKLCDFGLSHERGCKERSESTRYEGHFLYAAPEVLTGSRGPFNIYRADVYSLGAILADMLTKREPFEERKKFIRKEQFEMYQFIIAVRMTDPQTGRWQMVMDPLYERYTHACTPMMCMLLYYMVNEYPQMRWEAKEVLRHPLIWPMKETIGNYVNFN